MDTLIKFINKFTDIIKSAADTFIMRHNKDEPKFDLKNTLYASALILNSKNMDYAISDLETDNITFVSKNALVKKRNNERTHNHFQTINNNLLEALYDKSNGFIKPYSYSLDKHKSYLVETKYPDKKLFFLNYKGERKDLSAVTECN